jgi:phosphoribosylglycinamide formyltransferase-1
MSDSAAPPSIQESLPTAESLPIVVLISGGGSNLQAIIDAVAAGQLPVAIRAVISNRPAAQGLQRAERAGIPAEVLDHTAYASRADYDAALMARIDHYAPRLVVLAGFMRLLSDDFVNHYQGRLLNIHPSLLPKYKGLQTHQRAVDAGEREHGASVHFVTPELDGGPVILQARVPVKPGDSAEQLAARVLLQEHRIYPEVIRWFAEGRLQLRDQQIWLDGRPLKQPVQFDSQAPTP